MNPCMPTDTFCSDTPYHTDPNSLLKNAASGCGHQIYTTKENPCVKDIPEGVAEPVWGFFS